MSTAHENGDLPYRPNPPAFEPLTFEIIVPNAEGDGTRSLRITARQMPIYEADAMDERFLGEPWFEMVDGGGINGPRGVRANRERLKVVCERIEHVDGQDAPIVDAKAIAAFLDARGNEEVAYAGWTAYRALARTERLLFRLVRDPRAGTGGDAGETGGPADAGRATA